MHYHCEVWLPKVPKFESGLVDRKKLQGILEGILAPYSEEGANTRAAFWDWWQIGGRYTGQHDHYHGWEDPINQEPCDLCRGTGIRPDMSKEEMEWVRGCNGCDGKGIRTSYDYVDHEQDVMPLKDISEDLTCYTLIITGEKDRVYHSRKWDNKAKTFRDNKVFSGDNIKTFLKSKKITTGYLVIVDYHS
jgi:hypothetical protein